MSTGTRDVDLADTSEWDAQLGEILGVPALRSMPVRRFRRGLVPCLLIGLVVWPWLRLAGPESIELPELLLRSAAIVWMGIRIFSQTATLLVASSKGITVHRVAWHQVSPALARMPADEVVQCRTRAKGFRGRFWPAVWRVGPTRVAVTKDADVAALLRFAQLHTG